MRQMFKTVFILLVLLALAVPVGAAAETAEDISGSVFYSGGGLEDHAFLMDGVDTVGVYVNRDIQLSHPRGIAGVYLVFDQPCTYLVQDLDTGRVLEYEQQGFLHCFADLKEGFGTVPTSVSVEFPHGALLCEIRAFSEGELPPSVQRWNAPLTGGADIVLFSAHCDDEQLYFAGLLPHYAAQQLDVQVVYMTDHVGNEGSVRMHEALNGLWAVGVRAYPVFGYFPDFKLPYREHTYLEYINLGYSRDELLQFVVDNLRRFRPQVAVGHDLNGEYGHGMHKVYSDLLSRAVEVSADPQVFPDSAIRYGAWDVPKTYLHLYKENQLVMDFDQPLDAFDGMTAFEVCQKLGYPAHPSQQYGQYVYWLYGPNNSITKATQITHYNPAHYGLYRSTVGEDTQHNDMMENLISYAEQTRIHEAEMEAMRAAMEAARAAQEKESQLLRPPVPAETEKVEQIGAEAREFPAFAAVLALACVAAAAALFVISKKFEKK